MNRNGCGNLKYTKWKDQTGIKNCLVFEMRVHARIDDNPQNFNAFNSHDCQFFY